MDEIEKRKNEKVEKFKKRFSKSEKLSAFISDISDHIPTEEEFEKILNGDEKIYFGLGSIKIELDGNSFDVRYCDLDEEQKRRGKRPKIKEIFEENLGEIVEDSDLDEILIGKFERGDYKIIGEIENAHKSEKGIPILDIKRKINEIDKTSDEYEYEEDEYDEYDDYDYMPNTIPDKYEVIYNILRNRIPDYKSNEMFGENNNFCEIGKYSDMPGEEEIANILNSMSRETLKEYFSNNPDDLMLFHIMRNEYSDIMPLVDEKYLEEYNKKMEDLGTSLTGMSDEEVLKKYEELLAKRNELLKAKKEGKEIDITALEENNDFIEFVEGYGLSSKELQKMLSEKKLEMDREQEDSKRKKFEKDLSRENVVEYFLSKTPEELEKEYGTEIAKMVGFEQKNSHHCYDLWEHSLRTVEGISKESLTLEQFTKLRVAAFFHDIGKPDVAKINEKTGQQVFYGHAYHSVDVAKPILEKLEYSDDEIKQLSFYIAHHDDFISYKSSVPDKMKDHEFVREINVDSVTEKIIENKYDFEKMGYDKDQVRAIVYTLAHGKEPKFKDFKGEKISIPIDMKEVKEKINSGEYDSKYNPTLEDYQMLLQICKADANAQAERAERTLPDGKVVVDGSKKEKLENMSNIEKVTKEAYKNATEIIKEIPKKYTVEELSKKYSEYVQIGEEHSYEFNKLLNVAKNLISLKYEISSGKVENRRYGDRLTVDTMFIEDLVKILKENDLDCYDRYEREDNDLYIGEINTCTTLLIDGYEIEFDEYDGSTSQPHMEKKDNSDIPEFEFDKIMKILDTKIDEFIKNDNNQLRKNEISIDTKSMIDLQFKDLEGNDESIKQALIQKILEQQKIISEQQQEIMKLNNQKKEL